MLSYILSLVSDIEAPFCIVNLMRPSTIKGDSSISIVSLLFIFSFVLSVWIYFVVYFYELQENVCSSFICFYYFIFLTFIGFGCRGNGYGDSFAVWHNNYLVLIYSQNTSILQFILRSIDPSLIYIIHTYIP